MPGQGKLVRFVTTSPPRGGKSPLTKTGALLSGHVSWGTLPPGTVGATSPPSVSS